MSALLDAHRNEIVAVCQRHGVRALSVFGSAARDELGPDSDVDLLIEFDSSSGVGLFALQAIEEELASVLGRKVDLATPAILRNPYRRRSILRDMQAVYVS